MKKKRFTEQQIIGLLKESKAGVPVKDLCRRHGFSDAAFYKWRAKFGGMQVSPISVNELWCVALFSASRVSACALNRP